jgi:O-methyltransferase
VIGYLRPRVRYLLKSSLRPVLYRHPPIGLEPERLFLWMRTLLDTSNVDGAVVEIGCAAGGTAAVCDRMLRQVGVGKRYVCIDTFDGFVDTQFAVDAERGLTRRVRHQFSANSASLARRVVKGLGSPDIEFVRGDIVNLPAHRLPDRISACLVDVDLSGPVHAAMEKVYKRLSPGGVIVVDDCGEGPWKAKDGYRRFVQENGLDETYEFGMGFVTAP